MSGDFAGEGEGAGKILTILHHLKRHIHARKFDASMTYIWGTVCVGLGSFFLNPTSLFSKDTFSKSVGFDLGWVREDEPNLHD